MPVANYEPSRVIISVGGVNIDGFADGTFISAERTNDTFTKVTGADNRTTRIKQNDFSGTFTFTLLQSSLSNDVLTGFMVLDESTNDGVVPIIVKDLEGTTLLAAAQAWVRKPPVIEYSKDDSNREWMLDCGDMDIFAGGNPNLT